MFPFPGLTKGGMSAGGLVVGGTVNTILYVDASGNLGSSTNLAYTASTGIVQVTATTPEIRQVSSGDSQYTRITRTDTSAVAKRTNIVKRPGQPYSVLFDGTDDYINTSLDPSTELGQEVTIAAYVKPSAASNFRGVGGAHTGANVGLVFLQYDGSWSCNYGTGAGFATAASIALTLDIWTHVMAVFKGGASGYIKIYVNGVLAVNQAQTQSISHYTAFWWGRAFDSAGRYFEGRIDDMRVYNRILDAADAVTLTAGGNPDPTNLKQLLRADDGSGTTATDSSGNINTGTLTNGPTWSTDVPSVFVLDQDVEADLWKSEDGSANGEEGIQSYGHNAGRTLLKCGTSLQFMVGAGQVETFRINSAGQVVPVSVFHVNGQACIGSAHESGWQSSVRAPVGLGVQAFRSDYDSASGPTFFGFFTSDLEIGSMAVPNANTCLAFQSAQGVAFGTTTNQNYWFMHSSGRSQIGGFAAGAVLGDSGAQLAVVSQASTTITNILRGAASQSASFLQVQDSSNNVLINVTSNSGALGGVVINEQGSDADVRIEGDTDANLLVTDASTDRVGIKTNAPDTALHVAGTTKTNGLRLTAATELTIASGAITVTQGYHKVDTESDAATDDLDTINGGSEGDWLILRAENGARDIVVKDGTGNIQLDGGDFTLDNTLDKLVLFNDGAAWTEIARKDNGA